MQLRHVGDIVGNSTMLTMYSSGYTAVNVRKRLTIIDNASNGFTLYRLDSTDPIQVYLTEPPTIPVPKQVAFREESKLVIGGSNNSRVYLFDRRSGEIVDTLHHLRTGLVQSLAVSIHFVLPATDRWLSGSGC